MSRTAVGRGSDSRRCLRPLCARSDRCRGYGREGRAVMVPQDSLCSVLLTTGMNRAKHPVSLLLPFGARFRQSSIHEMPSMGVPTM